MGFGKKKKKKAEEVKSAPKKSVKVDMQHNPLYPPKKESDMQELLMALGTTVVCVLLVVLIVSKFSYMNQVNAYGSYGNNYDTAQQSTQQETQTGEEELQETEPEEDVQTFEEENGTQMEEETDQKDESEEAEEDSEKDRDYIFADSGSRYLSNSDLEGLSAEELSRARNEIYARHGRRFKDAGLQSYFDSKSWYNGTIEPDHFSEGMLNEYEKKNAETILSYEKSKGYK